MPHPHAPPRHSRLLNALVGVAALLLVAMSLGGPAEAAGPSSDPAPDWLPEVQDSEELHGAPAVEGVVESRSGRGTAARLTLLAWPDDSILEQLDAGEQVKLVPVAKAAAAADGSFAIRVDPAAPLGQLTSDDGTMHTTLVAEDSGTVGHYAVSLRSTGASWVEARADSEDEEPTAANATLRLQEGGEDAGDAPAAQDKYCTSHHMETYDPVYVLVGQAYTGPNAKATFTYQSGAESALGVGFSSSGEFGSYEASGTMSKSSNGTLTWPQAGQWARQHYDTQYRYAKYYVSCYNGTPYPTYWYEVRPYSWAGGQRTRTATTPGADYCTNMLAGGSFTKSTTNAVNWTNGVKLGAVVGIDLSSRTGYTTTASIKHDFVNSGQLCGTHDYPGGTPARLVGK